MGKQIIHTPEGVRDIYGEEYDKKLALEEKLHHCLKSYGYHDIQTPTFEFFDVFSSRIGTIPSKELYKFFDKEGNTLVLRPDFTPSIARAAAKYFMEEELPLRLCYKGNTYTNHISYQGLLKEMTQIGAELIGDPSPEGDAELISLVITCMKAAGIEEFQVSIGQVEFFKGICEEAGMNEEEEQNVRDKISNKNYFATEEILEQLKIKKHLKEVILQITDFFGSIEKMKEAKALVQNLRSKEAICRLERLYEVLLVYGVEKYVTFDLSMLSKYNYYTGVIFKAYTYGVGDALMKGGRYDKLLMEFGKNAPAIGFTIIVDTLLSAIARQKISLPGCLKQKGILYPEIMWKEAVLMAKELREKGERVELIKERKGKEKKDYISFGIRNQMSEIYSMKEKEWWKTKEWRDI
ncbi:MAG: ATP phosphoribosyltransferase regulatory subunit [Lachnospiraceae bacterium]|jgi:ATP phosphoribosyltransferase regulatory subunit|nr:ATP phosphoribosyltransferase regulatory subunit [Lachnospiraceae bacterium]